MKNEIQIYNFIEPNLIWSLANIFYNHIRIPLSSVKWISPKHPTVQINAALSQDQIDGFFTFIVSFTVMTSNEHDA